VWKDAFRHTCGSCFFRIMNKILVFFSLAWIACNAPGAPVITQQPNPTNSSVSLGAALTNRVFASSTNLPVSYQWRHDGIDVPDAVSNVLIMTNIVATQEGSYTVWVSDATGGVESRPWSVLVDTTFTKINGLEILKVGGVGVVWSDYDNDGFPDVFVGATTNNPTQNSPNLLYRNQQNGTFKQVPASALPADIGVISAGFVDYDNDGYLDLYGSKLGPDLLYHNNGDGTFSRTTNVVTSDTASGVGSAWGDFNNDGFVDLFVANEGSSNALFENDGHGGFRRVTNAIWNLNVASQAAAWADYDNDGLLDLFVANYQNNKNLLYHNEGRGQFTRITTGVIPNEVGRFGACAWGDYDNDGYFDLLAGSYGPGNNVLYHNNRDGTFTKVLNDIVATDPIHCDSAVWGDYDNDGYLDLLVSGEVAPHQHAFLYHNNGDGTFAKVTTGSPVNDVGEGRVCAFVDYDRDGFLDIWVAHTFGYMNSLYRNNANSNGWLRVKCEGRVSNRGGLGAKLRVKSTIQGKSFWQLRQITATETEASFGLGDATNIDILRIEWPSGIVQQFTNVTPKQFMTVREPSRLAAQPALQQGSVNLTLSGAKGQIYAIERSTNLTVWEEWKRITNSAARELINEPATSPDFFYRALEQP
jgi:hypothetical protein